MRDTVNSDRTPIDAELAALVFKAKFHKITQSHHLEVSSLNLMEGSLNRNKLVLPFCLQHKYLCPI